MRESKDKEIKIHLQNHHKRPRDKDQVFTKPVHFLTESISTSTQFIIFIFL